MTATERALSLVSIAAQAAYSKGAEDLVALDVSEKLPLTDVFLILSGATERQVNAIVDEIEDRLLQDAATKPLRREGRTEGRWALVDFGDLIVHAFHSEEREYYALERLWGDCPVVALPEEVAAPL